MTSESLGEPGSMPGGVGELFGLDKKAKDCSIRRE